MKLDVQFLASLNEVERRKRRLNLATEAMKVRSFMLKSYLTYQ